MNTLIFGIIVIIALFGLSLWQTKKTDTISTAYPVTNSFDHEQPTIRTDIGTAKKEPLYTEHPKWYSWRGRMDRGYYFLAILVIAFSELVSFTLVNTWGESLIYNIIDNIDDVSDSLLCKAAIIKIEIGFLELAYILLFIFLICKLFIATFVPRQLHDADLSGRWAWILVPHRFPSTQDCNKYAPPLDTAPKHAARNGNISKTAWLKLLFIALPACCLHSGCMLLSPYQITDYDPVPAYTAIEKGDLAEAKALIAEGAETSDPKCGNLLHAAAGTDRPEIIDYVLSLNLDIEEKDDCGRTPFFRAKLPMMKALLEHGATIDAENDDKVTPFYAEATTFSYLLTPESPRKQILEFLLKHGADVNHVHNKKTVLDAWQPSGEAISKQYMKWGCIVDANRWDQERQWIIPFLKEHGAKTYEELKREKKRKRQFSSCH